MVFVSCEGDRLLPALDFGLPICALISACFYRLANRIDEQKNSRKVKTTGG